MNIQEIDYSINLLQSLLWEYNEAINLETLLTEKQNWYNSNQSDFWSNWYNDVFNLDTANDFGLSVWSIILGLPSFIPDTPDPPDKINFGFGQYRANFNNGNFTSFDSSIGLTIDERRIILKLRYFQLISRGAIPETNRFLKLVFANYGQAWVIDNLDMTITYIFNFDISDDLIKVIKDYDILPRPAGVGVDYQNFTQAVFGFGPNRMNFNNGNFRKEL